MPKPKAMDVQGVVEPNGDGTSTLNLHWWQVGKWVFATVLPPLLLMAAWVGRTEQQLRDLEADQVTEDRAEVLASETATRCVEKHEERVRRELDRIRADQKIAQDERHRIGGKVDLLLRDRGLSPPEP